MERKNIFIAESRKGGGPSRRRGVHMATDSEIKRKCLSHCIRTLDESFDGDDKDNRNGTEDKRTVRRRVVTAVSNSFVLHFVRKVVK